MKKYPEKICDKCKKYFTPKAVNQKYCQDPCVYGRSIKDANENWGNRKEKPYVRKDETRVAYSFFRKKYGVNKRFKVVRG